MLIAGCCCCGASELGAFGFSNERSLVYCASTFNWGGGAASRAEAASGGAPLPLVMKVSPGTFSSEVRAVCSRIRSKGRKCRVGASGYHSPAVLHKDDCRTDKRDGRIGSGAQAPQFYVPHSLN